MIRRLRPGEGALWREIRLEALATAPAAFSSRHADWAARPLAEFEARIAESAVFVAEAAGAVLGSACLADDDDPAQAGRGWLVSVYVTPRARRQGLGAALVAAAVDAARASGKTEICLDVGQANTAARATYAQAGFVAPAQAARRQGAPSAAEITLHLALW